MKNASVIVFLLLAFQIHSQETEPFENNESFTYGEELYYKFKYSLYLNIPVGEMYMIVADKPKIIRGKKHYHLLGGGNTLRFYDPLFKVRDKYESMVEEKRFTPTVSIRNIHEGDYRSSEYYIYDHDKELIQNQDKKTFTIPYLTQDILSSVYLARTFDYSNATVGDSFMINVFIEDSLYYLGVKYLGKETLKINRKKYHCHKIKPILVVDRVFKSDDEMMLWVSDDKNKIPVKIHTGIKVGSINVTLENYKGLKHPLNYN